MAYILGIILVFIVGFVIGGCMMIDDIRKEIHKANSLEELRIRYARKK